MSVIEAVKWAEARLKLEGLEDPRLDADLLVAQVLRGTREQVYLARDRGLSAGQEEELLALLQRRLRREPLQYILQRQEFMGLDFYVDPRVLIPRPDSERLVEKLLEVGAGLSLGEIQRRMPPKERHRTALKKKWRVLDVGTGSGALAIAIAYYWPEAEVVGTDISTAALAVAARNAEALGVEVAWRQGDLLAPARQEHWDWIVCNPPYVTVSEYQACAPEIFFEPEQAFLGGEDGLDFYRRLAEETKPWREQGCGLLLEIGCHQAAAVRRLWADKSETASIFQDLAGRDRVIMVR